MRGADQEATVLTAAPVLLATGTDYTAESLAAAAPALAADAAGLSGGGGDAAEDPDERSGDTTAEVPAAPEPAAEPGTAAEPEAAAPGTAALPPELEGLRDPAAVTACATQLADGVPTTPVAVDLASYDGEPAAILVQPTPGDAATLDVYVVAPGCPAGEFRYFTRVPR
jgi:hypothetical protein